MRRSLQILLVVLASQAPAAAKDLRWPDPSISIPPLVREFIASESADYQGTTDEDLNACILGERYGYRAVVMMLMDDEEGERAAERYRVCRNGLGDLGGMFHRRRAECIGASLGYKWRFEFSREAAVQPAPKEQAVGELRFAATGGSAHLVPELP